jgi:hypothetical protein
MYKTGDRIRFRYTGMKAEILKDYGDGSYAVLLEGDEESIAFAEDIVHENEFGGQEKSEYQKQQKKAKKGLTTEELFYGKDNKEIKKNKKEIKTPEPQEFSAPEIRETEPTGTGCHLAFCETSMQQYTIYMVNDTEVSFGFEFKLYLQKQLIQGFNKVIASNTFYAIGEFSHSQFNDSPHIEFRCSSLKIEKTIKLKYKKFIGAFKKVPLMGLSTYCYLLFKKAKSYKQKKTTIEEYTREQSGEKSFKPFIYKKNDLADIASFETELDLHAEKLIRDTSKYTAGEIYEKQIRKLEEYINKAVEVGVSEVYIIHGLGKGKLQVGVKEYLKYHSEVSKTVNEYFDRYGFGATKVIFKS